MRGRWPTWFELVVLVIAIAGFLLLFGGRRKIGISPDGAEYLAFAEAIRTGTLLSASPDEIPRALAVRTPGYPTLVAVFETVTGSANAGVLWLHALVGIAALVYVPLALRLRCPVVVSAAAILWVQWTMRAFYRSAVTEWTCLNLLLILFAASARYWERPRLDKLAGLSLLATFLALTRPALIVFLALPVALAVVQSVLPRLRALTVAIAPFALVVMWMSFNLHRLDSFTLAPFSGMNLLGVATLIGHASPEEGDEPDFRRFVRDLNARKEPPPGERLDYRKLGTERLAAIFDRNVFQVAEPIAAENGWDRVRYNDMLVTYARRVIGENPGRYTDHVLFGASRLSTALPLLLPALVLPLYWLWRRKYVGLSLATLSFLSLHVVHVLLVASVQVVIFRYLALTHLPLLFASVVTTTCWAWPPIQRFVRRAKTPASGGTAPEEPPW